MEKACAEVANVNATRRDRQVPWEYGDMYVPACPTLLLTLADAGLLGESVPDYVVGQHTCVLFLSSVLAVLPSSPGLAVLTDRTHPPQGSGTPAFTRSISTSGSRSSKGCISFGSCYSCVMS